MKNKVLHSLSEARNSLDNLLANQETVSSIVQASELLVSTFQSGGRVFSCGNGGSMCDAMHFAEELTGRYRSDRPALAAVAISDPSHISCVGNDYGYEFIFSRYLEAHGRSGDTLLAISTSGTSKNVLQAVLAARKIGLKVITLTGRPKSLIGSQADLDLCTPGGAYADRVQELHIKLIHILIELVEHSLFSSKHSLGG